MKHMMPTKLVAVPAALSWLLGASAFWTLSVNLAFALQGLEVPTTFIWILAFGAGVAICGGISRQLSLQSYNYLMQVRLSRWIALRFRTEREFYEFVVMHRLDINELLKLSDSEWASFEAPEPKKDET